MVPTRRYAQPGRLSAGESGVLVGLRKDSDRMIATNLWMWTCSVGALAPDADLVRRTAGEVVRRPEFQLVPKRDKSALILYLLELVAKILKFLGQLWEISPVLACVIVVVLVAAIVALILHIGYTVKAAWAGETPAKATLANRRRQLDPEQIEREADEAARRQDYIAAVRLLFRAAVVRLEQAAGRTARPGTTNREYLSRYRAANFIDALRQFVEVIDAKWYGYGLCDADDYQRCRAAHALIRGAAGAFILGFNPCSRRGQSSSWSW